MNVVAVSNHKGGVGKTTTAINVAAALARKGMPVLLIDLDPQGHATLGVGFEMEERREEVPTIARIFTDRRADINEAVVDTAEPRLKLVPADIRLSKAAKLLNMRPLKEIVLRNALENLSGYDYVIIDCQPSLEVLTQNALVAADKILIPTTLDGFALMGLGDLIETIQEIDEIRGSLEPGGESSSDWRILLTMVSGVGEERNQAAQRILSSSFSIWLFAIVLKKNWSRGAQDYRNLVKEILEIWPS
jgi:cellulose biosynthesis protein BcsQ